MRGGDAADDDDDDVDDGDASEAAWVAMMTERSSVLTGVDDGEARWMCSERAERECDVVRQAMSCKSAVYLKALSRRLFY